MKPVTFVIRCRMKLVTAQTQMLPSGCVDHFFHLIEMTSTCVFEWSAQINFRRERFVRGCKNPISYLEASGSDSYRLLLTSQLYLFESSRE